jgi:CBS domain-containing protein
MVMLSDFLRFRLTDVQGATDRLRDVVVDLAAGDYPPVSQLLLRDPAGQPTSLAWDAVHSVDWRGRRILVRDRRAGRPAPPEALARAVLAGRDIMDALIVDLGRRSTLRANDLWLREQDGHLWLAGADASPWAVLRRFGRGLLGRGAERRLVDWKDVEFLRGDPCAAREGRDYHCQITRLQPPEIARLLDALPYLHAAELLTLIPDPVAADTLEAMTLDRQAQVIQVLEHDQAARLLGLMAPDAAADLLGVLKPERAQAFLGHMPEEQRAPLIDLLRYPDDTAGGIMTNQLVCVPADLRVGDARRELKPRIGAPDFAQYLYVVDNDDNRHLQGVVTLREFAVAEDRQLIGGLMNPRVTTIDPLEPASEAARRVAEQHLAALPVTGRDGRLLGAITVDAALAQIAPASWRNEAPRIFS